MRAGCPEKLWVSYPGRWKARQVFWADWCCERWCRPWRVIGLDKLQGLSKLKCFYESVRNNVGLERRTEVGAGLKGYYRDFSRSWISILSHLVL